MSNFIHSVYLKERNQEEYRKLASFTTWEKARCFALDYFKKQYNSMHDPQFVSKGGRILKDSHGNYIEIAEEPLDDPFLTTKFKREIFLVHVRETDHGSQSYQFNNLEDAHDFAEEKRCEIDPDKSVWNKVPYSSMCEWYANAGFVSVMHRFVCF